MLLVAAMAGWIFQTGCIRDIQRELEILWAPEANINNVYGSWLVHTFGPQILQFW
jgi:hypothetical protein